MAEMIPVHASLPSCPVDGALQEDDTTTTTTTPVALTASPDSESFVFVEARHPNKLLEGLNSLRLGNTFCDVTLCCGGQEFPCHRNVLASFSPYFQAMFTTEWTESQQNKVVINGVDPQMIDVLVCYAYTSTVRISMENVQALLAASDLLNVPAVKEACCRFMARHLDEKNCVGIHLFAEAHSCKELEKRSMSYILEHFSVVHLQEEFLSLGVDKLTEVLASDHVNVPKEEKVFEAAMLWLERCPTRRQSFEKVLEHIRLPLISPAFLLQGVLECVDLVPGCQRLFSEALLPSAGHRARPRWATVCEVMVVVGEEVVGVKAVFQRLESFDPQTNQWRTLGRLPFYLESFDLVVSGSDLYLAGGDPYQGSGIRFRDLWRYDSSRNLWSEMAPMIESHHDWGLVMLDDYVYAVRGLGRTRVLSVERYDPAANTWQLMKPVPICDNVYYPAVVALDGLIYVIGGTLSGNVYTYCPQTSGSTQVAPMGIMRCKSTACVLKGKIYVIGGMQEWQDMHESFVECYNPETDQWTTCASMNKRRISPGVAVVDGKIYVLGGLAERSDTIERYCDEADSWEIVGKMPDNLFRCGLNCVSLKLRMDAQTAYESATAYNTVP